MNSLSDRIDLHFFSIIYYWNFISFFGCIMFIGFYVILIPYVNICTFEEAVFSSRPDSFTLAETVFFFSQLRVSGHGHW